MTAFFTAIFRSALLFFGYFGIHYMCAWLLPLSSAGYTVCANGIAMLACISVCVFQRKASLRAAGTRPMRASVCFAAVGAGVGGCLLVRLMMLTVPFPESWMQSYSERVELVQQAPAWVLYVSTLLVAPIAEELVFRGLIYRTLKNGMPRVMAVMIASAAFAVLHGTLMWMIYTFWFGVLLCWLYEQARSLWACVACHMAFNVVGQISLIGVLPDIAVIAVFAAGAVVFAGSLWYIRKAVQGQ